MPLGIQGELGRPRPRPQSLLFPLLVSRVCIFIISSIDSIKQRAGTCGTQSRVQGLESSPPRFRLYAIALFSFHNDYCSSSTTTTTTCIYIKSPTRKTSAFYTCKRPTLQSKHAVFLSFFLFLFSLIHRVPSPPLPRRSTHKANCWLDTVDHMNTTVTNDNRNATRGKKADSLATEFTRRSRAGTMAYITGHPCIKSKRIHATHTHLPSSLLFSSLPLLAFRL